MPSKTFCTTNSWWVTSVGDHHNSHGRYAIRVNGNKMSMFSRSVGNQSRQSENDWNVMSNDRQKMSWLSDKLDAKQNVTKYIMVATTVWVLPLIITVYVSWFELRFRQERWLTETMAFGSTLACQLEYRVWLKHSHFAFGMSLRTFIEYQQWASSSNGYLHCFLW